MPRGAARDKQASNARRRLVRGNGEAADWALANPVAIQALIAAVAAQGGAVSFGYTRDLGAYTLTFLDGDDRWTDIYRPSDDIDELLGANARQWTGELPGAT